MSENKGIKDGIKLNGLLAIKIKNKYKSLKTLLKLLFTNKLTGLAFIVIVVLVIVAVFAPIIAPYPEQGLGKVNLDEVFQSPNAKHLFGTDELGRDILSRVIYGARISLSISIITIVIAVSIAIPIGVVAGYYGGFIDEIIMRITDVFLSFPPLLIAIVITSFLGPSLKNAVIAIAIAWWPSYARLIRAQVISMREKPFIMASKCIGTSDLKIMISHVIPNSIAPIIIQASMDLGGVILTAASLSFIGLGAQAPQPEWGLIISTSRKFIMDVWWYTTFPGMLIFITVLCFNLLGDGLREVLDPKTRVR